MTERILDYSALDCVWAVTQQKLLANQSLKEKYTHLSFLSYSKRHWLVQAGNNHLQCYILEHELM